MLRSHWADLYTIGAAVVARGNSWSTWEVDP